MLITPTNTLNNINTIYNQKTRLTASKSNTTCNDTFRQNKTQTFPNISFTSNAINVNSKFISSDELKKIGDFSQKLFSYTTSKNLKIPQKNILARLVPVELGNNIEMNKGQYLGAYSVLLNKIKINPEKAKFIHNKLTSVIAHECTHCYMSNLRAVFLKDMNFHEILNLAIDTLLKRIEIGEPEEYACTLNRQTHHYDLIEIPALSKHERKALCQTLNDIIRNKNKYLNDDLKLSDNGISIIKKELIPQIDTFITDGPQKEDSINMLLDYINSFTDRVNFSYTTLSLRNSTKTSLETPLSKREKELVICHLTSPLKTRENNAANSHNYIDYFLDEEELLANTTASFCELKKMQTKIKKIKEKNLTPHKSLIEDLKKFENDTRVFTELNQYKRLRQKIASADKDPQKVSNMLNERRNVLNLFENKYKSIPEIYNAVLNKEYNPTQEQFKALMDYKAHKLNIEDLLADTPENNELKAKVNLCMNKISNYIAMGTKGKFPKYFQNTTPQK